MTITSQHVFFGWRSVTLVSLLMMAIAIMPTMAAGGYADSAWPRFALNDNNSLASPYTGPQTGIIAWNYTITTGTNYASTAIGPDGTLYMGGSDGKVYAVNPDGTVKWSCTTGGSMYGTPSVAADGTIYMGSSDGKLYAVNPDGTLKWSYTTGGKIQASTAIASDGTIYFGSWDKSIYAINPDGTKKWSYATTGRITYNTPAIGTDGTMYFTATRSGMLYAFNPDGTIKWSYSSGGSNFVTSPSIGPDGTIYSEDADRRFYAINPDGTLKWKNTLPVTNDFGAAYAIGSDGTIYVASTGPSTAVYAYNPDGTIKWSYGSGIEGVYSSPVLGSDGTLYVGTSIGRVAALNSDGTLKWVNTTRSTLCRSPSLGSDGTLYVVGNNGDLYAFRDPVATPTADFIATPLSGPAPLTVQFTDASTSSETLTYAWDFNDDGTVDSTEQSPEFTYANSGIYDVRLTVTNSVGSDTKVMKAYVTVDQSTVAPEFPTMALPVALIVGMLGTVLLIRRTKEN